MVPPEVTASRWAPRRPVRVSERRSQVMRARSSAKSSLGYLPGEHVEDRLEDRPGQGGVGRGPAGEGQHVVDGPVVERAHRDDLLGEHVEGVGGHVQRLDLAGAASARRRRRSARGRRGTWGRARRGRPPPPGGRRGRRAAAREATDGGDSTWTTRSTAPMSMPSSRLLVATTAGQPPGLQVLLDGGRAAPCSPSRGGPGRAPPGRPRTARTGPSPGPGCAAARPGGAPRRRRPPCPRRRRPRPVPPRSR